MATDPANQLPPELQVDFVVRSDALTKSGGDSLQVEEYIRFLRGAGVDTAIVPFHPAMVLRPHATVHVINVDRPYDFLVTARKASSNAVIVSTIHHSLTKVRLMRQREGGYGFRSVVGRVLPESVREWLASGARSWLASESLRDRLASLSSLARTALLVPGVWRHVGRELDAAAAVTLLAQGEAAALSADTGWRARNGVLIPNGRPRSESPAVALGWSERDIGVLVVGRVEPRKRQLEVARAAAELGVQVTIVGPLTQPDGAFAAGFRAAAAAPGVSYLGARTHAEVLALMGRSRVLLNASWVEVQSLVDLEAAFMGCFVVANDGGNSAEWLPEHVTEVGPQLSVMLPEAQRLADLSRGPGVPSYPWTWDESGRVLLQTYRRALA